MRKTNHNGIAAHVTGMLETSGAHADFEAATGEFSETLRGVRPPGAPHSAWQLLEHLRLAQRDILDFSRNSGYKELEWPSEYWPPTEVPPSAKAWDESVGAFRRDAAEMARLVEDPERDLFARIPHGSGQTLLREALVLARHNSYHIGQLVMLRKMLGAWPK